MEAEKVHMIHATTGDVLCGAHRPRYTTRDEGAVSCPLCRAILDGSALVHGTVEEVQRRVTEKLAELQRDPGVRVLTAFARSVVQADREGRAGRG